jgi:hypothetical protein
MESPHKHVVSMGMGIEIPMALETAVIKKIEVDNVYHLIPHHFELCRILNIITGMAG